MCPKNSNFHQKCSKLRHCATSIRVSERNSRVPFESSLLRGSPTGPRLRQSGRGGAPLSSICLGLNEVTILFSCVPVSEHKCSSQSSVWSLRVYLRASEAFGPRVLRTRSELFSFLPSLCDFCVIKNAPEVNTAVKL